MGIEFDTRSVAPDKRLVLWQDIVCDVFVELDCKCMEEKPFQGNLSQSVIGETSCTRVQTSRHSVIRTPSRISRASKDFILIALHKEGRGAVLQDGREALIHPGQMVLYDTTRPYELRFDSDCSQTIFQWPRHLLRRRIGVVDQLMATSFVSERPLERLAFDFLSAVSQTILEIDEEPASRLLDQALDIVAVAISDRLKNKPVGSSVNRTMMLYRLYRFIDSRLSDPELSVADAARALGVTPRYINTLLSADKTSFNRYLQHMRLERCRNALVDRAQAHCRISEIAFSWGFSDLAHFSHRFRERFGISPRDYRGTHLAA